MSIQIDENSCIGCGRCTEICPGNLLHLNAVHRAEISAPEDCWGCTACLKSCPAEAIRFFLGLDVGGRGSTLQVKTERGISHWKIQKWDGTQWQLDVDGREANQY